MSQKTALRLVALVAGVLFGGGLALSGMLQPRKVIAFLDVGGRWDPSLCCVMLGAIGVHWLAYWLQRRRSRPPFAERFLVPVRRAIDLRLLAGAALFGVGWGIGGYCPGPALASLVSLERGCLLFVSCLLLGTWLAARFETPRDVSRAHAPQAVIGEALDPHRQA